MPAIDETANIYEQTTLLSQRSILTLVRLAKEDVEYLNELMKKRTVAKEFHGDL